MFKVGDKVICINTKWSIEADIGLTLGKEYVVEEIMPGDQLWIVTDKGTPFGFKQHRFTLVKTPVNYKGPKTGGTLCSS